jgi:hypothetical protein
MSPRLRRGLPLVVVALGFLALAAVPLLAQETVASVTPRPEVQRPVAFDMLPALRDVRPLQPEWTAKHEAPRPLPLPGATASPDGAQQFAYGPLVSFTPGLSFAGVGQGDYGFSPNAAPPDTNGSVGATQYVQWVNESFAVFDKSTGALLYGPAAGNTLWSGFGGGCQSNNDGDPIVVYDKANNRWLMTQFSVSTTPYLQCVAVSATSDATGAWYRYSYSFGNGFNDYPKFGVWADGYYATYNIFTNGRTFAGAKACAYDRAAMLSGQSATQICFSTSTSYGGLLPADIDGSTMPPTGSPEYFVNFGSNRLNIWKLHADFVTPANSTFTGPTALTVASFSAACSGGTCVPQPSTSQKLDSLADRLMYRLAYRNFGDHEAMVVNHSVTVGAKRSSYSGVRWYELRIANQTVSVYQQGTFAPDSTYRWMGSAAMDKFGNIALGYSKSSSSVKPAIWFTARQPADPPGSMESETQLEIGGGSQLARLSRWGDYSSFAVDPSDDCTLWYTSEYLKTSGTFNWSTWISSVKLPGCN